MKAITLDSRIKKHLTTKAGLVAKKYDKVMDMLMRPNTKLYLVGWSIGKGYLSIKGVSTYNATIEGLKLLGVDYEVGNDAPRGGKVGDYIQLTKKGKRQVKLYTEEKIAEKIRIEAAIEEINEKQRLLRAEVEAKKTAAKEKFGQIMSKIEGENYQDSCKRLSAALNEIGVKLDGVEFYAVLNSIVKAK